MTKLSELVGITMDIDFSIKSFDIFPERMSADSVEDNVNSGNYGAGTGIISCVDFLDGDKGAVWFALPYLSGWEVNVPVQLELALALEGSGSGGNGVRFNVKYWYLANGDDEPNSASEWQSEDFDKAFAVGTEDEGVYNVVGVSGWDNGDPTADAVDGLPGYTSRPDIMVIRLERDPTHVNDDFESTVHLIKARLFQPYT